MSRESVLTTAGTFLTQGSYSQSMSPTLSVTRSRWETLTQWTSLPDDIATFWQSLTQEELTAVVDPNNYMGTRLGLLAFLPAPTSEGELHSPLNTLFVYPHNFAASPVGAVHPHAQIVVFSEQYRLTGDPDFLFLYNGSPVGIIELKTFWKVTAQLIDEVVFGKVPLLV